HQTDRLHVASFVERFPGMLTYATMQVLLQSIADHGLNSDAPVLVIDKQASTLHICFFDGSRLVYANDFDGMGTADDRYHLSAVVKHLGLDEKRPKIYLSGDIRPEDEIHQWSVAHSNEVTFADSGTLVRITMPEQLISQQH